MLDRENLRDRPAGRMPDDVGPLDLQRIHQPDDVGRHAVDGKPAARQVALADPAMVVGDDVEIFGESGDLIVPERGEPGQPRHEEDGEPDTLPLIIERAVADYDPRHRDLPLQDRASVSPRWEPVKRERRWGAMQARRPGWSQAALRCKTVPKI